MGGLIVLCAIGLWIWACVALARAATGRIGARRWRALIAALFFVVLLPLPVADEIVAEHQRETVCREGAVLRIDEQRIKGRRVRFASEPLNAVVPGVAIPVTFSKGVLRDVDTGEVLGSRGRYVVKGGVLVRMLGFSESNPPLVTRRYCAPEQDFGELAARLGFEIIN